tara:strand:+ start:375 stop:1268 length:894 start_codon:yes stop_codon:yes gene_type:complete
MSTVQKTMMTPPSVPQTPPKVVKKRGPKKKTEPKTEPKTEIKTEPNTDSEVVKEEAIESDSPEEKTDANNTKKPKTATLSAKYKKYVLYSYYLIEKVREVHPEMDLQFLETAAMIHDTVEQQTAFVQGFDEKTVANSLKLKKKTLKDAEKLQTKQIKKTLTKIKRTKDIQQQKDDHGNLLAILFPKTNEAIDDSFILQSTLVINALNDKSKHPPQNKNKNKNNKTTTQNNNNQDLVADIVAAATNTNTNTDDQELEVTLCTIQNKKFLTDNQNNLYHTTTHQLIATFDPTNNNILYL